MHLQCITLITAATLAGLIAAKPDMVIKESINTPLDWIRREPAPDTHIINLQVALKQRDFPSFEEKLLDISDPDSTSYGQWMLQEEVNSFLQPSQDSIDAVKRWFEDHGLEERNTKRSIAGDWLTVPVTIAQARAMLGDADFAIWQHRDTGEKLIRTTEYSLPRSVADHIDLIGPTTYFNQVRTLDKLGKRSTTFKWKAEQPSTKKYFVAAQKQVTTAQSKMQKVNSSKANAPPSSCNTYVVSMTCLRKFYGTFNYKVANPTSQIIGVSGFLGQYANFADLKQFFKTQRNAAYKNDYKFDVVLNGAGASNDQNNPGGEANLDVQTVGAIAYNMSYTYISTPGSPPFIPDRRTPTNTNEPYRTEFEYLLSLPDDELPSILTTSYGDDEQTVPLAYQKRVCSEAASLGARGMTIFFASGDSGVGSGTRKGCVSNDGKNTTIFLPNFPASCPYVTTVGATEQFNPEVASGPIAGYYGGGGFSNTFPMPAWQKKVVQPYINSLGNMYQGLYNKAGRGYPDLSAQGSNFYTVLGGSVGTISGTSASCPLTAAIFALINDQRISAGKSKLGFINPALYKGAGIAGLNDITQGSNKGCGTAGFPAKKGWDAATGFGTPNFALLSKAFP